VRRLNHHLGLALNPNYADGFVEGSWDKIGEDGPEESVSANVFMAK
jgi:hypothetical protein